MTANTKLTFSFPSRKRTFCLEVTKMKTIINVFYTPVYYPFANYREKAVSKTEPSFYLRYPILQRKELEELQRFLMIRQQLYLRQEEKATIQSITQAAKLWYEPANADFLLMQQLLPYLAENPDQSQKRFAYTLTLLSDPQKLDSFLSSENFPSCWLFIVNFLNSLTDPQKFSLAETLFAVLFARSIEAVDPELAATLAIFPKNLEILRNGR